MDNKVTEQNVRIREVTTMTSQGAKKIIFTACHSGTLKHGKLKLAFASLNVISASPISFLMSRINFTVLLLFEFLKKNHLPVRQVKNRFTSLIAESTSPRLSDTTIFARCITII